MLGKFPRLPEINVADLAELRRAGTAHTVLDIRDRDEIEICSIQPSTWIPMQEVAGRMQELPREHPLVVLCHHGVRSAGVARVLRDNGFDNVCNLAGGIDAWAQRIDPQMRRY